MKNDRLLAATILFCIASATCCAQSVKAGSIFLRYQVTEKNAAQPTFKRSQQEIAGLEKTFKDMGLDEKDVKANLDAIAKEDEMSRQGKTTEKKLDVIIEDAHVRLMSTSPDDILTQEFLSQKEYGFFYGSDATYSHFAQGLIAKSDWLNNDSSKGAPYHWLPNSIGHRFATFLIGYSSLESLIQKMSVFSQMKGVENLEEGRYYWSIKFQDNSEQVSEIDWRVGSAESYVGSKLVVKDWKIVEGRDVASTFSITLFASDGSVMAERKFKLLKDSKLSSVTKSEVFPEVPRGSLVVDNRSPRPASYRLKSNNIPKVDEIEAYVIPDKPVPQKQNMTIGWLLTGIIAVVGVWVLVRNLQKKV